MGPFPAMPSSKLLRTVLLFVTMMTDAVLLITPIIQIFATCTRVVRHGSVHLTEIIYSVQRKVKVSLIVVSVTYTGVLVSAQEFKK